MKHQLYSYVLGIVNDAALRVVPLLGLLLVTNMLERSLMGLAVVATVAFGIVSLGAFDAYLAGTGTLDDFMLWVNLALWLGNIPVVAGAAMCGARRMKDVLPSTAPAVAPGATIACPRCRTAVVRPAVGNPVCPTCAYPGPDSRRPAATAAMARPPAQ